MSASGLQIIIFDKIDNISTKLRDGYTTGRTGVHDNQLLAKNGTIQQCMSNW